MYSALSIADYILDNYPNIEITNLKLQKLLYLAQGFYLAKTNSPLFNENIIAWKFGPVVKEVYRVFNKYVARPIDQPYRQNIISLDKSKDSDIKMVIEYIINEYGSKSAGDLVTLTHTQAP